MAAIEEAAVAVEVIVTPTKSDVPAPEKEPAEPKAKKSAARKKSLTPSHPPFIEVSTGKHSISL